MSTFKDFSKLPKELRDLVWQASKPTTTSISILETEFEVTSISAPPSLLTSTKEARATALSWNLSKYPIWGPEDWVDIYLDPEEMILELVIDPAKSASLTITWTDIWTVLGDALPAAKQLHIVCSKPERLARLYMLPEAEYVGVGQACNERGLFTDEETVSSERKTREGLHMGLTVTASKHTVEDIDNGASSVEVDVWRLVEEEVRDEFRPEAKVFATKTFEYVEVDSIRQMSVMQLHNAAKASPLPVQDCGVEESGLEVEEVVKKPGDRLTEDALAKHLAEMEKLFPKSPYQDDGEDVGGSVCPEYD
jgi:hypothetical protein